MLTGRTFQNNNPDRPADVHQHVIVRTNKVGGSVIEIIDDYTPRQGDQIRDGSQQQEVNNELNIDNMKFYESTDVSDLLESLPEKLSSSVADKLKELGYTVETKEDLLISAWSFYLENLKKKTILLPRASELMINQWDLTDWVKIMKEYAFNGRFPVTLDKNQEKQVCHILAHLGQVSRFALYGPFKIGGTEVSEQYVKAIAQMPFNKDQKRAIYTVTFGETKGSPYFIRHQVWKGGTVNSISDIVDHTFFLSEKGNPVGAEFALAVGLIQWTASRGVDLIKGAAGSVFAGMELAYQCGTLVKDVQKQMAASDQYGWSKAWNKKNGSFDEYYDAFFRKIVFGTGRNESYAVHRAQRLKNQTDEKFKPYFQLLNKYLA